MDAMGLGEERKVVSAEVDGEESVWGELPAAAVGGDGVLVPNQGQKRKVSQNEKERATTALVAASGGTHRPKTTLAAIPRT